MQALENTNASPILEEVKLPTIWTHERHSQDEAQAWRMSEGRRYEMESIRDGQSSKREDAGLRKSREVGNTVFF